jgi:TctA family transporter
MLEGLQQVFCDPYVIVIVVVAAAYGVFMGGVPGLTATMAVALIVPATYEMGVVPALALVVTLEACAIFAGDIPTVLLRIPGTPSSAAYVDDAYALTRAGKSDQALGTSLVFSVAGGLFGTAVLLLFAPQLARVATAFSFPEEFWLYLIGLSCAVVVSRGSSLRAALGLLIGLLLSTVGLGAVHTQPRFTFGQSELQYGIKLIPAMIGLFGLSEIFRNVLVLDKRRRTVQGSPPHGQDSAASRWQRLIIRPVATVIGPALPLLWRRKWHALRSGAIGSFIGMLPGAGADIGAWVSLAASKRTSKKPDEYGHGSLEGISDATAANNSALAGAWVPALVFGIPGDSITAMVIGVLLMKNIQPGPEIFTAQGSLVYSVCFIFLLANLVLLPVGLLAIKVGGHVVRTPRRVLLPVILLCCVIGSYALENEYFDIGVMLVMGLLGFVLERRQVPLGPIVLGLILGRPLEERFIQTLTSADGSPAALFGFMPNAPHRWGATVLAVLCILIWLAPVVAWVLSRRPVAGQR